MYLTIGHDFPRMNQHYYNDLIIEVFDTPAYSFDSSENTNTYLNVYFGDDGRELPVSKHGIKVYKANKEINSCLIIGSGGATGVQKNSTLLDHDQLLVCCCNTVFCLTLPDLYLKWQTKADTATCFQIFKLENDYVVHGELEITRIDRDGNIQWQFSGADIFVSIDGQKEFIISGNYIMLSDFSNHKYKIDFQGKQI